MNFARVFAETVGQPPVADKDFLSALGIDWKLLILQIVAFLILVWALGKWVYPQLMKAVDQRQADIESAAKASKEAQDTAAETQKETEKLLSEAKKQASDIVETAKLEAGEIVSGSEEKAKKSAEQIVSNAHAQLQKDVEAARRALHNETLDLVVLATEKLTGQKYGSKSDEALIKSFFKEPK